ncbi:hypothetical protein ACE1OC_13480 [Streptomyces sp. DSM 116496]|uniref:hypothetical protein n=1 Tax=Streptomyces stoeckheimensis TaxID=3344656 RepID=UPI0038B30E65
MEFFPIVTLVIATFLLLIGIVGRGASMGSSQFHITLEGSIGRLPRVAILAVSVATYALAIFGFFYVAESKSNSGSSPTTATSTEAQYSTISVHVSSTLTDGATSEHDEITLAGAGPLTLDMDTSNRNASGSFELSGRLSGLTVNYSIKVVITNSNGEEEEFSGEGEVLVGSDLAYVVTFDENGVLILS